MVKQNIVGPLRDQSDWAQNDEHRLGFIKNKPFYDTRKTAPLTIEWDRSNATNIEEFIGGRETVDFRAGEFIFVKMSEVAPTFEEMLTAEWYLCTNNSFSGNAGSLDTTDLESIDGVPFIQVSSGGKIIGWVAKQTISMEGITFTKGLYFALYTRDFLSYPYRLYIPSATTGELKTLDPKYLPSGVGGGIPTIDLTDVILEQPGEAVELTEEQLSKIGTDFCPKFIIVKLYGLAIGFLVNPMSSEEIGVVYTGTVANGEGMIFELVIARNETSPILVLNTYSLQSLTEE